MFGRSRSDAGVWIAGRVDGEAHLTMLRDFVAPYAPDRLVEWGSITKAVTAACVRAAVAQGLLRERDEVAHIVPRLTGAQFSIGEVLEHRSGLPRMARPIRAMFERDPYADVDDGRLDPATVTPLLRRGDFLYSNLGYAVLGEVLDEVTGDWWEWARAQVLEPAGVGSAALRPHPSECVLPRDSAGRALAPWSIGAGAYAAAGGVWSTFRDLCSFLSTAVRDPATPSGWHRAPGADVINGATRHSRACAIRVHGSHQVLVTHGLRIGSRLERRTVELARTTDFGGTPPA